MTQNFVEFAMDRMADIRSSAAATSSPVYITAPGTPLYPTWDAARNITKGYLESTYVFAAVDRVATNVARCALRAGKDPNKPETFSEAAQIAQLLGPSFPGPAPGWSPRTFWKWTTAQYILTGKFAWAIERDPRTKQIVYFWPLEAQHLLPIPKPKNSRLPGYFSEFQYGNRGSDAFQIFRPDDIVYCWNPAQNDKRQPESWLDGAKMDISTSQMLDAYNFSLLSNNATPSTIVGTEPFAEPEQRRKFRQQFLQKFGGAGKAGGTMFVEFDPDEGPEGQTTNNVDSKISVKRLGLTPAEFMSVEQSIEYTNDISVAMKTPLSVMGDSTKAKFQNFDMDYRNWWRGTLVPLLENIADQINTNVVPKMADPTFQVWFDTSHEKVVNDFVEPQIVTALVEKKIIDRDEGRRMIGLPAWDTVEHADTTDMDPPPPVVVAPVPDAPKTPPVPNLRHSAPEDHAPIASGHLGPHLSREQTIKAHERMMTTAIRRQITLHREVVQQRLSGRRGRSATDLSELFNVEFWEQRMAADLEPIYVAMADFYDIPTDARHSLVRKLMNDTIDRLRSAETVEDAFADIEERVEKTTRETMRSFEPVPLEHVEALLKAIDRGKVTPSEAAQFVGDL